MEPEATLPVAAPAPPVHVDPHVERITTDMSFIMDRAYLEQISRTHPGVFMKFAAQVLNMKLSNGQDRHQTVVNVVNAIPRSPLDGLPPGFTLK
jgi:hypothetical protein